MASDEAKALAALQDELGLPLTPDADPLQFVPVAPSGASTAGDEAEGENRAARRPVRDSEGRELPGFFGNQNVPCAMLPAAFDYGTPETLCRFLRARNYDVPKAAELYRKCIAFREKWRVDSILEEDDPLDEMWSREAPIAHCNYDKRGRPLVIERTGEVRLGKMIPPLTREDFFYRHVRHMEILMRRVALARQHFGSHVSQVVIVMDLKNLPWTMGSNDLPLFKQTLQIDSEYYPERLAKFFIVNAPMIFRPIWALVRPWLAKATQSKFHVLGSGYASTLLDYVDADQLPREYGGTYDGEIDSINHVGSGYAWPTTKTACQRQATAPDTEVDGGADASTSATAAAGGSNGGDVPTSAPAAKGATSTDL